MLRLLIILLICALSNFSASTTHAEEAEVISPQKAYSRALMEHLRQHWDFQVKPEDFEDSVTIKLKIDRDGTLSEATILTNAANENLDAEALKQLSEMQPFPKMPAEIDENIAFVQFPYRLSPTSITVNLSDKEKYLKEIDKQPEVKQQNP